METADSVRQETLIDADAATVFAFLTDADRLTRWMGVSATLEPRPGGLYLVDMGNGTVVRGEFKDPKSEDSGRSLPLAQRVHDAALPVEHGDELGHEVGHRPPRHAVGSRLGSQHRALLGPLLTVDPKADQRTDHAAELDRLVLGQVAEMLNLDCSVGVLVNGERIDHANGALVVQALKLGDDLAVELRLAKA